MSSHLLYGFLPPKESATATMWWCSSRGDGRSSNRTTNSISNSASNSASNSTSNSTSHGIPLSIRHYSVILPRHIPVVEAVGASHLTDEEVEAHNKESTLAIGKSGFATTLSWSDSVTTTRNNPHLSSLAE